VLAEPELQDQFAYNGRHRHQGICPENRKPGLTPGKLLPFSAVWPPLSVTVMV